MLNWTWKVMKKGVFRIKHDSFNGHPEHDIPIDTLFVSFCFEYILK